MLSLVLQPLRSVHFLYAASWGGIYFFRRNKMRLRDIKNKEVFKDTMNLHFSAEDFLKELLNILNSNYVGDFTVKNNTMLFECINGQKFYLTVSEIY